MAAHKGHGVKARIGMVPGVKADFQDLFVHLIQQPLKFRLKVDEACGMGVDADGKAVFLGPELGDLRDAVAEGGPFGAVHLFGIRRPACSGCAAG